MALVCCGQGIGTAPVEETALMAPLQKKNKKP